MNKMKRMKYWLLLALIATVQSVSAHQYHDAAAFDAYGNVKWVLTDVGLLYFKRMAVLISQNLQPFLIMKNIRLNVTQRDM